MLGKGRSWLLPALILVVSGIPFGDGHAGAPSAALAQSVYLTLEPVVSGLNDPVDVTHAGDGSQRLFITLQAGQIVVFDGAQLLPTPFLDIQLLVDDGGSEQGLLGLAFHPNYESNGFFYVNYTDNAGDTVIARYKVSGNPNLADPASVLTLLTVPQPYSNHNGGQLQFGPDGYLYIGLGDGGSGGDPENRAQNLNTLLGKILRIDVDSGSPYAIPPDNPFIASGLDEIWALGLRNPWRFSFDRLTGDLFIGDVGQNLWEEVDFLAAGSGGANFQWRCSEGNHDYNSSPPCTSGTLTPPVLEYDHGPQGGCSITGGYRYRGTRSPLLTGVYLFADYCSGRIWGATENAGVWTKEELLDTSYLISTFGQDEAGEIYLAQHGSSGAVYRLGGSRFADVARSHWAWSYIDPLYTAGLTAGCTSNPLQYCPEADVTRAEIAVFLKKGIHGSSYTPPAPNGSHPFSDLAGHWAEAWMEELYDEGLTSGYPDGTYRPDASVTRAEMAVFLLKAKHGSSYVAPVPSGGLFSDVAGHWAEQWIEQLKEEGITSGYPDGTFRPESPVTRAEIAVFLVRTFSLPLP